MNKGRFLKYCSRYFYQMSNNGMRLQPVIKMKPTNIRSLCMSLTIVPVVMAFFPDKQKQKNAKLIQLADELYNTNDFDQLLATLRKEESTDEPEILWRLARATYEKSRSTTVNEEKISLLETALGHVTHALEIDNNCWAAHKWRAILLDHVWRHKDTKGRIKQSYEIRTHIEKAIELNPLDSTSYYILGEWCYTFADLPWHMRKIASILFASPPTSTFEEAYSFFDKAEKNSPDFYSKNLLMLAKCQLKMKNKELAVQYLQKVLKYNQKTLDDKEANKEATEILKEIGVNV